MKPTPTQLSMLSLLVMSDGWEYDSGGHRIFDPEIASEYFSELVESFTFEQFMEISTWIYKRPPYVPTSLEL
jgi:hypothetical protein